MNIAKAGNLAEASILVSGVLEAAQNAADQDLYRIYKINDGADDCRDGNDACDLHTQQTDGKRRVETGGKR